MPAARTTGVALAAGARPTSRTGLEEATARPSLRRVPGRRPGVSDEDGVSLGEARDDLGLPAVGDADEHVHRGGLALLQPVDAPAARTFPRGGFPGREYHRLRTRRSARDAGRGGAPTAPAPARATGCTSTAPRAGTLLAGGPVAQGRVDDP